GARVVEGDPRDVDRGRGGADGRGILVVVHLVEHRHGRLEVRRHLPQQGAVQRVVVTLVDARGELVAVVLGVGVDPARTVLAEAADAETDLVLDQRAAQREALFVAHAAAGDSGDADAGRARVGGQAGGRGDEAEGAAFRGAAVQRALRAAQHFGAVEVIEQRHGRARAGQQAVGVALHHRQVVDVDAGARGRARGAGAGVAADV